MQESYDSLIKTKCSLMFNQILATGSYGCFNRSTPRICVIVSRTPARCTALSNFVERHVQAISTPNGGEICLAAAVPAGEVVPANSCDCGNLHQRIFYFEARKPVVRHITRALLSRGGRFRFDSFALLIQRT